jgi:hypothetical protein
MDWDEDAGWNGMRIVIFPMSESKLIEEGL